MRTMLAVVACCLLGACAGMGAETAEKEKVTDIGALAKSYAKQMKNWSKLNAVEREAALAKCPDLEALIGTPGKVTGTCCGESTKAVLVRLKRIQLSDYACVAVEVRVLTAKGAHIDDKVSAKGTITKCTLNTGDYGASIYITIDSGE